MLVIGPATTEGIEYVRLYASDVVGFDAVLSYNEAHP